MKKILAAIFSLVILTAVAAPVFAETLIDPGVAKNFADQIKPQAGFSSMKVGDVVSMVIKAALSLLAIIFVILIIISGFRWMTANGNEENIKQAQETIKAAVIGLIIVLAAYGITYFIFKYLPFGAVSGPQGGTGG